MSRLVLTCVASRYDFKYLDSEVAFLTSTTRESFLSFFDQQFAPASRSLLAVWVHCNPSPTVDAVPAAEAAAAVAVGAASDSVPTVTVTSPGVVVDWVAVANAAAPGAVVLGPDADIPAFHATRVLFNRASR